MAVSVVGGMLLSTLFTLFVVPSAYSLIDDMVSWNEARRREGVPLRSGLGDLVRRVKHRHGPPAAPAAPAPQA